MALYPASLSQPNSQGQSENLAASPSIGNAKPPSDNTSLGIRMLMIPADTDTTPENQGGWLMKEYTICVAFAISFFSDKATLFSYALNDSYNNMLVLGRFDGLQFREACTRVSISIYTGIHKVIPVHAHPQSQSCTLASTKSIMYTRIHKITHVHTHPQNQ